MARTPPPGIDPVPTPAPQRGDRTTFSARVDAFIRWIVLAVTQFQAVATNVYNNALDAFQSATGAATSATNAGNSATAAAGSATAAGNSATAAADASSSAQLYAQGLSATSTSSLTISTGSKTFTGAGLVTKQFTVGQVLYVVNPANIAQWMSGRVSAYSSNGASSSLTLDVTEVNPTTSGQTAANWSISVSGVKGATGATGGVTGGNLTGALNEKRADNDVASSATPDIWSGNGNYVGVTGSATITGFTAAPQAGAKRRLLITASMAITAGTNLIVKGVASGVTSLLVAGDEVEVVAETTTRFRVTLFKADGSSLVGAAFLQAQDQKATGTAAGSAAVGAEVVRNLTVATANTITGAGLSANRITLPQGVYDIFASAPSKNNMGSRLSIWNVTDNTRAIVGQSNFSGDGTVGLMVTASGRISISSAKDFEFRHYFAGSNTSADNLGSAVSQTGVPEIYLSVEVRKIS